MERDILDKKNKIIEQLKLCNYDDDVKHIKNIDPYKPMLNLTQEQLCLEEIVENKDINKTLSKIIFDLDILDDEMYNLSNYINDYISSTKSQLNNNQNILDKINTKLDSFVILSNYYKCSNITSASDYEITGDYNIEKNIISAAILNQNNININIDKVYGNGLPGNKYILNNTPNKDDVNNLIDNSLLTTYEYERIIVPKDTKTINEDFNINKYDYLNTHEDKVICTLFISSNKPINNISIISSNSDLVLESMLSSLDGYNFSPIIEKKVPINTKHYEINNLILNNKKICFSDAKYLRLTISSENFTNEEVVFKE